MKAAPKQEVNVCGGRWDGAVGGLGHTDAPWGHGVGTEPRASTNACWSNPSHRGRESISRPRDYYFYFIRLKIQTWPHRSPGQSLWLPAGRGCEEPPVPVQMRGELRFDTSAHPLLTRSEAAHLSQPIPPPQHPDPPGAVLCALAPLHPQSTAFPECGDPKARRPPKRSIHRPSPSRG